MRKENYAIQVTKEEKTGLIRGGEFSSSLIQRYISFLDVKPRTVEAYSKNLKPFFLFAQSKGVNSSWQITRSLILEYRDFLKAGKKPTTVQSYITALRLFIRWASQEGLMENVADHIKGAKLDRSHKKDYLTAEQVKRLLASVDRSSLSGARDYAILLLSITGALRTIEIVRANIEDLRTVGDSPVLYVQGKGREEKNEFIKLDPHTEEAIRDYLSKRDDIRDGEPLFSSLSHNGMGTRMTTRAISWIVKEHLKRAGFNSSRLTAHSLRHTGATLSLLAGRPLEEVQQFMRHANIATTMIYNHALDKAKNQCSFAIAGSIF